MTRLRASFLIAMGVVSASGWPALAASAPMTGASTTMPVDRQCELRVDGTVYLQQRCGVVIDADGSFTLNVRRDGDAVAYFAYVAVDRDGRATGSWNRDKGSAHAWADLGALRQDGACWVNRHTQICASDP